MPNQFVISSLSTCLASLFLSVFVYLRNPHGKLINRVFALYNFSIAFWSFGFFKMITAQHVSQGLFWSRLLHLGAIFIPITFLHFVFTILDIVKKRSKVILGCYVCGVVLFLLCLTDLFIISPIGKFDFKYFVTPGPAYHIFTLFFFGIIVFNLIELFREYRASSGSRRNMIKYLFLAHWIGYAGGGTAFLPLFNIPMPGWGLYLIPLCMIIIAYIIVKHRLLDITLIGRQVLIFASYLITACVVSSSVAFSAYNYPILLAVTFSFLLLIAPFVYRFLQRLSQPFVDRVILRDKYSYLSIMSKFWEGDEVVYTSEQLGWTTVPALAELMELSSCSLLIFDRDEMALVAKAQVGLDEVFGGPELLSIGLGKIDPYDPLIRYLIETKEIINREELAAKGEEKSQEALATMDKIRAQIVVPLFVDKRLTAILNLGPKESGDMFHEQDIDMLRHFARMAENHLAHIVFLEKSVFYSGNIAHDIRSPFKAGLIYDYMEDIRKGPLNPTQREAVDELEKRIEAIQKMSELMVDIYASLERVVEGKSKPERMDYNKKVTDTSRPYAKQAQERKLIFKVSLPKEPVFVYAEVMDVERILNELLTNAFKYTDKGSITLEVLQENPQEVLTKITDTGCGIPEDKLSLIFEPFRRLKQGMDKEGIGIGLASVRRLVEANGGRIWVKSKPNQGSEFCFVLPSAEAQKGGTEDV